jgi:DnaJ-class molecular chaperone
MAGNKWEGKAFYQVLGVTQSSALEEIKSEYRWLARKFHPDQNNGDERAAKKFGEITEAYEVLSKVSSREDYDRFISLGNPAQPTEPPKPSAHPNNTQAQSKPAYRTANANSGTKKQTPKTESNFSKPKASSAPKVQRISEKPSAGAVAATLIFVGLALLVAMSA